MLAPSSKFMYTVHSPLDPGWEIILHIPIIFNLKCLRYSHAVIQIKLLLNFKMEKCSITNRRNKWQSNFVLMSRTNNLVHIGSVLEISMEDWTSYFCVTPSEHYFFLLKNHLAILCEQYTPDVLWSLKWLTSLTIPSNIFVEIEKLYIV